MRLIVKFGTESLLGSDGKLSEQIFAEIAQQVSVVLEQGHEVIIVSSGAIQAGREEAERLNVSTDSFDKKDLAGFGSPRLMATWQEAFDKHFILAGQIWVTHANLHNEGERKSTLSSISNYCRSGRIIPIVNENDIISAREIDLMDLKISENDQLARLISKATDPDYVFCVTSVGGVFEQDPQVCPSARRFAEIDTANLPVWAVSTGTKSKSGNGGMNRKIIEMAKCCQTGRRVAIGSIADDGIIRFANGEAVGTLLGNVNRF